MSDRPLLSVVVLIFLVGITPRVGSQTEYQFERIHPVLQQPWYFSILDGVAVDGDGYVYVVDQVANRLLKFNESGRLVDFWQSATGFQGSVDIDSRGFVYAGAGGRTEKYTPEGDFILAFGQGGRIVLDDLDALFEVTSSVRRYTPPADQLDTSPHEFERAFGANGSNPGEYRSVVSVATDRDGALYIADPQLNFVHKFLPDGTFATRFGGLGNGPGEFAVFAPLAVQVSVDNEVYASGGTAGLQIFDTDGNFLRATPVTGGYEEFDFDQTGSVIANIELKAVGKIDSSGRESFRWRAGSDLPERFTSVQGVAQDSSGFIYVADSCAIKKFTPDFEFLTSFGQGCLDMSIAVGDNDQLFVYAIFDVFVYSPPQDGLAQTPHTLEATWDIGVDARRYVLSANAGTDTLTQVQFDFRVPNELGNVGANAGTSYNLAIGDVNGDFAPDLVASMDGVNRLYINSDGYSFAPGADLGTATDTTRAGVLTDVDGNATLDFVAANDGAPNRLYLNDGSGAFSLAGPIDASVDSTQVLIAADVDGINGPDLFFGNLGPNRLYLNDGSGNFIAASGFPAGTAQTHGAVFADIDNDEDLDLLLANNGINQIHRNDGAGGFSAAENLTDDLHDSRDIDVIDQNNDQQVDIVVANFNQINRLYLNQGDSFAGVDIDDRIEPTTSVATVGPTFFGARVFFGNLGVANVYYEIGLSVFTQETEFGGANSMTWDVVGDRFGVLAPGLVQQNRGLLDVQIGPSGLVYLTDDVNGQVYRYTQDGTFVNAISTRTLAGQNQLRPFSIGLDSNENLYLTGFPTNRLSKYRAPADLLSSESHVFERELGGSNLLLRTAVTVNAADEVLVTEDLQRVVIYDTSFQRLGTLGERGFGPGFFETASKLDTGADGRLFVGEAGLSRLQVFSPRSGTTDNARAIIVAGGGPYPGNALWDATQLNASFAYRVLVAQGYSADSILYLSDNGDLDLSGNGVVDVDGPATTANLQAAINNFAADAGSLVVYLIDHGGLNKFRISGDEVLDAGVLGNWLDTWQSNHPGIALTVIYDACQSGSFMDKLRPPSGTDRVVIASSDADQNAYFVSQGTLSFSNQFWTHIFNGLSLGDAYVLARDSQQATFVNQSALLDANADGSFNTPADLALARSQFIGNGTLLSGSAPSIGAVSDSQTISNGGSATLQAVDVTDLDGIARVWAVLRPPAFNPAAADNPVQGLPVVDLARVGTTDTYEVDHAGFVSEGTYQITIYAEDAVGNRATPRVTFVTVNNPLRRRAIVVAGGEIGSTRFTENARNASRAYRALVEQGYGSAGESCSGSASLCDNNCDNVCYLSNDGTSGVDTAPTIDNLSESITNWGTQNTQDLTLYIVATRTAAGYRLNSGEEIDAASLKGWLDTAQQTLAGTVTVIIEGDDGRSFVEPLAPLPGNQRILISSTGTGEPASFLSGGQVTFSKFFWNQVLNGANIRQAFQLARTAIRFRAGSQSAQLDDNGNGIPNEFTDGLLAGRYALGSGVLLAGDDPVVSSLTVNAQLTSAFEPVNATVTSTGVIDRLDLFVNQPDGTLISQPLSRKSDRAYGDQSYGLCAGSGIYEIAVYATDKDGNTSLPLTQTVSRSDACDEFLFFSSFE